MGILSVLFKGGTQVAKNVSPKILKEGEIIATKFVREGKAILNGEFPGLLSSSQADKFISQGTKEARVIGDHIVSGGRYPGRHRRVITKLTPKGSVVSESFDIAGQPFYREYIGKNGVIGYKNMMGPHSVVLRPGDNIVTNYGQRIHTAVTPQIPPLVEDAVGMTEHANASNSVYQALREIGMV